KRSAAERAMAIFRVGLLRVFGLGSLLRAIVPLRYANDDREEHQHNTDEGQHATCSLPGKIPARHCGACLTTGRRATRGRGQCPQLYPPGGWAPDECHELCGQGRWPWLAVVDANSSLETALCAFPTTVSGTGRRRARIIWPKNEKRKEKGRRETA